MPPDIVALAADHAGYALKAHLAAWLTARGAKIADLGTDSEDSVDYPDFADLLVRRVLSGEVGCGILVCGSGVGMSIAANRHSGIRAALVRDAEGATLARQHNDANVLVLPGRQISIEVAQDCVDAFLNSAFEGGRHQRRLDKID